MPILALVAFDQRGLTGQRQPQTAGATGGSAPIPRTMPSLQLRGELELVVATIRGPMSLALGSSSMVKGPVCCWHKVVVPKPGRGGA